MQVISHRQTKIQKRGAKDINDTLFQIILGAISVIGAVITYVAIPYIKATADSSKLAQYKEWAALAVNTAEMLWSEGGQGKDKKAYVTEFLNHLFNHKKTVITPEQINILIESAVKEMKEALS